MDKGPLVHIGDSNGVDMGCPTCEAILHPLHENLVETSRLVMWIPGNSWKTTPFTRALSENTIFTTRSGGPIENRRVLCNEGWTGLQGVRNFLIVSYRMPFRDRLSIGGPDDQ